MKEYYNSYLAKFGKYEHLNDLKQGRMFFNTIKKYREDETKYRGDTLEGKILLDPQKFYIWDDNGENIFDKFPSPDQITYGYANDDTLMFCASILDEKVLCKDKEKTLKLREDFLSEMKKFGDYVLIINPNELMDKLEIRYKTGEIQYCKSKPVTYYDKKIKEKTIKRSLEDDLYFIKNKTYEIQNEWRTIIYGNSINRLDNGAYILEIGPLEYSALFTFDQFSTYSVKYEDE